LKSISLSKRTLLSLLALLLLVPAVPAKASPAPSAGLSPLENALVSKMTDEVYSAYWTLRASLKTLITTTEEFSALIVGYTIDELIEKSSLIVLAKSTGERESFLTWATSGGQTIQTDHSFTVDTVLKGTPYGDAIAVRTDGGTVGAYTQIWSSNPEFEPDTTYLLFLYHPEVGNGIHTEGNYYYVRGLVQGAYVPDENGGFYNPWTEEELPAEALVSPLMDEEGPSAEEQRRELIETYRSNYESGFDTLEEYQRNMEELDEYAKTVS